MAFDRIVTLRLSEADWQRIKAIAEQRGEKAGPMLRGWVGDRLFDDAWVGQLHQSSDSVTISSPLKNVQIRYE